MVTIASYGEQLGAGTTRLLTVTGKLLPEVEFIQVGVTPTNSHTILQLVGLVVVIPVCVAVWL